MEEFEFDKYNITPSGKVYLKSSKSLFQEVELPPQVLARFILNKKNDESLFYYPKSTKIKNIMNRNNLALIDSDVITINKVDYTRHPKFTHLFVSSGYKVFDISTFKFNKKPKLSESAQLITARHGRTIQYITRRDRASNNETVLAKDGIINVIEDELVIHCDNNVILRAPINDIKAYELMNLSGINIVYNGECYVAYYTKGIENK